MVSLDTGHAALAHGRHGAPPLVEIVAALAGRIGHVHLQAADGHADRNRHPGEGGIPRVPVVAALAGAAPEAPLILEVGERQDRLPDTVPPARTARPCPPRRGGPQEQGSGRAGLLAPAHGSGCDDGTVGAGIRIAQGTAARAKPDHAALARLDGLVGAHTQAVAIQVEPVFEALAQRRARRDLTPSEGIDLWGRHGRRELAARVVAQSDIDPDASACVAYGYRMKQISSAKAATRALRRMPANTAALIRSQIEAYAAHPASQGNKVKSLKGRGGIRLRVGDWRVIMDARANVLPAGSRYRITRRCPGLKGNDTNARST